MGSNKKAEALTTLIILVNMVLSRFVSANAACPSFDACFKTPIVGVKIGSQKESQCCKELTGTPDSFLDICLCISLRNAAAGEAIAANSAKIAKDLTKLFRVVGKPDTNGIPDVSEVPVFNREFLRAVVDACGLDPAKYRCSH